MVFLFFLVTIIDSFDEICILIMIHKLDSKLISKTKKKLLLLLLNIWLSYLEVTLHIQALKQGSNYTPKKKKKILQYFQFQLQYFQPKKKQLAFRLVCYSTFSKKNFSFNKISRFQTNPNSLIFDFRFFLVCMSNFYEFKLCFFFLFFFFSHVWINW